MKAKVTLLITYYLQQQKPGFDILHNIYCYINADKGYY